MSRNYQKSFASKGNLQIPSVQTTYEKKSFCLYSYKILNLYSERNKGHNFSTHFPC